jgi:hypothetical protein
MVSGMKSTEIPLDSIGSVNYQTKALGGNITVSAAGSEKHIGKMKKGDVRDIANLISEATAKMKQQTAAPAAAPASSAIDELKKLAELKEAGVLSEEEFNEQKEKLLG